ncbi:ATP-binding cassette, subfamily B, HlyB/CyaB/ATP-binding cassette, subfamily B, RtxB [Arboricoccus pini]|uniref:ATP-binding cassette, subfamily B, HlyB/CyaB/ATP-binding cassette, subfamily B, RtxB n=1 Tax=Arboricoccus pini TaxID=1963835 RepID=A0A212Q1J2_9PROT|nr:peptidase domain-containing ABC transporter [Arboricoccus pini]SNB53150.1 ATP-binding cassette, subfamily B, HlyB/CyaB/ATP-binding cassette, subfamily B, RtxB [Arboricoccus pini]
MSEHSLQATPPLARSVDDSFALALGRSRRAFGELVLASAVINLLALATPLFMMTVYNKVIAHSALSTLDALAVGMGVLILFEMILRVVRGQVAARMGARLDVAIGEALFRRVLHLPAGAVEQLSASGLADRFRSLDRLRSFVANQLPILFVDLAFTLVFLLALLVVSPALALVTAICMTGFVVLTTLAHGRQARLQQTLAREAGAKAAWVDESMSQFSSVRSLGLEEMVRLRFERGLVATAWTAWNVGSLGSLTAGIAQMLQAAAAVGIVYLGAREIIAGSLTIGGLVAATILSGRALAPMRQAVGAFEQLRDARDAWVRLNDLPAAEAPRQSLAWAGRIEGKIGFEKVSFSYEGGRGRVLDAFSLEVRPGTMLAIVGPPGSGKSTILRLLLGLAVPETGKITIDDRDLAHAPMAQVRQQIGIVPQEIHLFSGSIAENISAGSQACTLERIIAAAKFVGLQEIVERLPQGYETKLGERGSGLSQGQRQLIAIARALVRNPRILILDEASSALDEHSERHLLDNLRRAGRGRTILMVTHRPAVLLACDEAIVVERGRLSFKGSPAEVAAVVRADVGARAARAG